FHRLRARSRYVLAPTRPWRCASDRSCRNPRRPQSAVRAAAHRRCPVLTGGPQIADGSCTPPHQHRDIVTLPGEVSIQNGGNHGWVADAETAIPIERPVRVEPVGVHDERRVVAPWVGVLAEMACLVSERSAVRNRLACDALANDGAAHVADTGKPGGMLVR